MERTRTQRLYARILLSAAVLFAASWGAVAQDAGPPDVDDVPDAAPGEPADDGEGIGESGVEMTRPNVFTIHVQGADLRGVLRLLSTQGQKNIIATREVTGTVTADLYNVTFTEALEAILRSTGFVYQQKGNFIYVHTPQQLAEIKEAERELLVRTFHLSYVTATDVKTLIEPVMSKEGSISISPSAAQGISPSDTETGGNSYAIPDVMVVRDYEANLKAVEKIINELDVKPRQVLIEATVMRATLSEDDALGMEFNTLAGIDFEGIGASSNGLTDLTTGTLAGDALNDAKATFRTDLNSAIPAGGFTMGFISNEVSFFVRALESVTDVTVMANPKLLVLNKQRGEVLVGQRDGYITTTFTETTASQTVEFLETGTKLVVRPYITRDDYVRLEIHPEDSTGSVDQVGEFALPNERTTEVTSNVLVRDGHTIVIGGLFRERTQNGRAQMPGLGNMPYVGSLFRRTIDETDREEVIVLITPRIIRQEADEAVSEQFKDDIERFRIGQRKGLQWWGRGRLAQTYVRKAYEAAQKGDRDKALWNVDMALSLSPRMIEAIRLKERLTNKAYWEGEHRRSAVKYIIQNMVMQELGRPVGDVVPPDKPLDTGKLDAEVRDALGIEPRPRQPLGIDQPDVQTDPQPDRDTTSGEDDDADAQVKSGRQSADHENRSQVAPKPLKPAPAD